MVAIEEDRRLACGSSDCVVSTESLHGCGLHFPKGIKINWGLLLDPRAYCGRQMIECEGDNKETSLTGAVYPAEVGSLVAVDLLYWQ